MERPSYLSQYMFDWDSIDVVLGGKSSLDSRFFMSPLRDQEHVKEFLKAYGLDYNNPVNRAELFGNFQEALQFIRRYFLKEGSEYGLDLKIPNSIIMITDVGDLFLMATGNYPDSEIEDTLWAEVVLKVMHTILHVDKDLRTNYFSVIQTQIFDRFYRYLIREDDKLFLGDAKEGVKIPLVEFVTKSKKTRDSVIIKLLHKAENVAEELFDRIGVRIVTETRFDTLSIMRFLLEKFVVIPHNIKPSRSINTLINLHKYKEKHGNLVKLALRNNLTEKKFLKAAEKEVRECLNLEDNDRNSHSLNKYQSIQFTCRQLIKYKNPFLKDFNGLRKDAKNNSDNDFAKKILAMDVSLISRDIRFFYPYEVQIVDKDSHKINTEGEASHVEYKKSQVQSAIRRIFKNLLELKGIEF
ncbi:TIGR04552 family protein [Bacteriovoracaceae bacterium]|nr:TIGR04552 family protein [Bacteriovoracaceae bacterium]